MAAKRNRLNVSDMTREGKHLTVQAIFCAWHSVCRTCSLINYISSNPLGTGDGDGSGDDKGMMDNLLETLRKGGDNEASRRDRRRNKARAPDHSASVAASKAQDLLASLREESAHIQLLHE